MADAWAVVVDGIIDVLTVAPSRRLAIGDWLITKHQITGLGFASDEHIERLWNAYRDGASALKVIIAINGDDGC
jgi:hypothetical protein